MILQLKKDEFFTRWKSNQVQNMRKVQLFPGVDQLQEKSNIDYMGFTSL